MKFKIYTADNRCYTEEHSSRAEAIKHIFHNAIKYSTGSLLKQDYTEIYQYYNETQDYRLAAIVDPIMNKINTEYDLNHWL